MLCLLFILLVLALLSVSYCAYSLFYEVCGLIYYLFKKYNDNLSVDEIKRLATMAKGFHKDMKRRRKSKFKR